MAIASASLTSASVSEGASEGLEFSVIGYGFSGVLVEVISGEATVDDLQVGSPSISSIQIGSYMEQARYYPLLATKDDEIENDEDAIVRVTLDGATFSDGSSSQDFTLTVIDNPPPTGDAVLSGSPIQGSTLVADTADISDANGLGDFSYQWLRDGMPIEGANESSYQLTQADVASSISYSVDYIDGAGAEESLNSSQGVEIENINDPAQGTVNIVGSPQRGNTVIAEVDEVSDPDGLGEFRFQWTRDGSAIDGADDSEYALGYDDVGAVIGVQVSYTDDFGTSEVLESETTEPVTQPEGSEEDDLLEGGELGDLLDGKGGDDSIDGFAGDDIILGGEGNDNLAGGSGDDTIAASAGQDSVVGEDGADFIGGGLGNDWIDGGAGNDTIGAGSGDDSVSGGDGNDVIAGGAGADSLSGSGGSDTIGSSYGHDHVMGDGGNDSLGGGFGMDTIDGGAGADSIGGGEGNDVVNGNGGDDFLAGGGRDDFIRGGAGDDLINGGDGDDTMIGGEGADQFIFNDLVAGDTDTILQFEDGQDTFRITGVENAPGSGLQGYVEALNITEATVDGQSGVSMSFGGHTILVQGVGVAELGLEDFTFL